MSFSYDIKNEEIDFNKVYQSLFMEQELVGYEQRAKHVLLLEAMNMFNTYGMNSLRINKENIKITPNIHIIETFKNNEIKTLFKRIAPGVLGAGIYQINMVVDTILVSLVSSGAVSWLYYANRLQQLPLGVIGAAISVALLPLLSKKLKANEIDEAKTTQDKAIFYGIIMSLPSAIIFICLADSLIQLLFEHGKFTSSDTTNTANT